VMEHLREFTEMDLLRMLLSATVETWRQRSQRGRQG
jgi:hypothetical protein